MAPALLKEPADRAGAAEPELAVKLARLRHSRPKSPSSSLAGGRQKQVKYFLHTITTIKLVRIMMTSQNFWAEINTIM